MEDLKYQMAHDVYAMYPAPYEPAYLLKEKIHLFCCADYITHVSIYEKTRNSTFISDNSFMGFCRDIFLNPTLDYFEMFKFHDNAEYVSYESLWKKMLSYNHCQDVDRTPFQHLSLKNAVDVNNIKCIHQNKNEYFKHEPCPDFISKENFIQAIQFGNGNCTLFLVEFKTTFSIITCMGS